MRSNPVQERRKATRRAMGQRVLAAMVKANINQAELARHTGIQASSLSNMISGKRAISADQLQLISRALGCTASDLLPQPGPLVELGPAPQEPHTTWESRDDANEQVAASTSGLPCGALRPCGSGWSSSPIGPLLRLAADQRQQHPEGHPE